VLALLLIAGITANGLITIRLINTQRAQQAQFCRTEQDLRDEITALQAQVQAGSYVYVPPTPACPGVLIRIK
jgi:hypothetical protein